MILYTVLVIDVDGCLHEHRAFEKESMALNLYLEYKKDALYSNTNTFNIMYGIIEAE